jgi:hypothetical protein
MTEFNEFWVKWSIGSHFKIYSLRWQPRFRCTCAELSRYFRCNIAEWPIEMAAEVSLCPGYVIGSWAIHAVSCRDVGFWPCIRAWILRASTRFLSYSLISVIDRPKLAHIYVRQINQAETFRETSHLSNCHLGLQWRTRCMSLSRSQEIADRWRAGSLYDCPTERRQYMWHFLFRY